MRTSSSGPLVSILVLCALLSCCVPVWAVNLDAQSAFLDQINLPRHLNLSPEKKIVVAIVDDGIRTTHMELRDLIWENPYEIDGNSVDDDGNGLIDDVNGWDVADNNNTVSPPSDRLKDYYHGTHLAGIVARIAKTMYGETASHAISIMPVKALSDRAPDTAIRDGYKGIDYAINAGADIILCAWSVGHISSDEIKILQKAKEKGIIVVASAGNIPDENEQYPAADESVFAVAALNNGKIAKESNYGDFIDISAPGFGIFSASAMSDSAVALHEGTSQAAAVTAAAIAILKSQFPLESNDRIKACLKNSASTLDLASMDHLVKYGAGKLNLSASWDCLSTDMSFTTSRTRPQGYLDINRGKGGESSWTIKPVGIFKGIWFVKPAQQISHEQYTLTFYQNNFDSEKPFATFLLSNMPDKFFVPGANTTIKVQINNKQDTADSLLMEYRTEGIKFRTLYCRGTVYLNEAGIVDDGSSDNSYSANSDCKWQITAPDNQVVHFKFSEFDTEAKTDFVRFYDGTVPYEQLTMAMFSGPDIPPEFTSWSNEVLVWFVTDGENQKQGWKLIFNFIDKEKAVYPRPENPRKNN